MIRFFAFLVLGVGVFTLGFRLAAGAPQPTVRPGACKSVKFKQNLDSAYYEVRCSLPVPAIVALEPLR